MSRPLVRAVHWMKELEALTTWAENLRGSNKLSDS